MKKKIYEVRCENLKTGNVEVIKRMTSKDCAKAYAHRCNKNSNGLLKYRANRKSG